MNISSRLRVGMLIGAVCTAGIGAHAVTAQAVDNLLNGPACSGDVAVTGPGSTAQANAIPGFNTVLQNGSANGISEVDGLGNTEPGCGTAVSVTDSLGGSGAGITALETRGAPISFSDDPLSAAAQAQATAGGGTNASPVHTVPVAILPVSVIYNLACYTGLKLSASVTAEIYAGVITTWDNVALTVDNPGINTACAGVHINVTARADVSGTTFVFKSYLAKGNAAFAAYRADQLNTSWPAQDTGLNPIACRGAGTTAEIACVVNTANSIGYAATSNVRKSTTPPAEAAVSNAAAQFSTWSSGSCSLAALTAPIPPTTLGNWSGTDFTDPAQGYGICAYTYDLTYELFKTAGFSQGQMQTVVDFLTAATSNAGQSTLPTTDYDKLPLPTQTVAQLAPEEITFK